MPPEGADETTKAAGERRPDYKEIWTREVSWTTKRYGHAGRTTKGRGHGRPSRPPRPTLADRPGRPARVCEKRSPARGKTARVCEEQSKQPESALADRLGRPALRGPTCARTIEAATRDKLTKPIFSRIDLVSPGRDAARKAPAGRPAHMRVHTAARAARARQLVGSLQVRAPRCASLRLVASRCSWQTLWRPRRRAWRTSAASGRASSRSGLSASMRLIAPCCVLIACYCALLRRAASSLRIIAPHIAPREGRFGGCLSASMRRVVVAYSCAWFGEGFFRKGRVSAGYTDMHRNKREDPVRK